jgi:hypothetical protein
MVAIPANAPTSAPYSEPVVRFLAGFDPMVNRSKKSCQGQLTRWLDRDNVDPEYLEKPISWNGASIIRFMICMGPLSSIFDICTFSINWCVLYPPSAIAECNGLTRFRYGIRTANSPLVPRAQANWFLEGAVTQVSDDRYHFATLADVCSLIVCISSSLSIFSALPKFHSFNLEPPPLSCSSPLGWSWSQWRFHGFPVLTQH